MDMVQNLVALRKAHGLTQAQLARTAGMELAMVRAVEQMEGDPSLSMLEQYGQALGVELVMVPSALQREVLAFVQSGGRWLGQPAGVGAPRSIVDDILQRDGPDENPSPLDWGR